MRLRRRGSICIIQIPVRWWSSISIHLSKNAFKSEAIQTYIRRLFCRSYGATWSDLWPAFESSDWLECGVRCGVSEA
jgi:hypothetical protein